MVVVRLCLNTTLTVAVLATSLVVAVLIHNSLDISTAVDLIDHHPFARDSTLIYCYCLGRILKMELYMDYVALPMAVIGMTFGIVAFTRIAALEAELKKRGHLDESYDSGEK